MLYTCKSYTNLETPDMTSDVISVGIAVFVAFGVEEFFDDGLLVVEEAQLASHDGFGQFLLGQVTMLPLVQTHRVLVFLKIHKKATCSKIREVNRCKLYVTVSSY